MITIPQLLSLCMTISDAPRPGHGIELLDHLCKRYDMPMPLLSKSHLRLFATKRFATYLAHLVLAGHDTVRVSTLVQLFNRTRDMIINGRPVRSFERRYDIHKRLNTRYACATGLYTPTTDEYRIPF